MNDYKEFNCPYQQNCPDYHPSIMCDTHLHVKCENYGHEKELFDWLDNYRKYEGLIDKIEEADEW